MYAVIFDKTLNRITRVFPCTLLEYNSKIKSLSTDSVEYLWLDHSALQRVQIGDFLSYPYYYSVLVGSTPTENILLKMQSASARTEPLKVGFSGTPINVPSWANYLAIEYLVAAGGSGSTDVVGGCGSYVTNVVINLGASRSISAKIGEGGKYGNNGEDTILSIDGKTVYHLGGGLSGDLTMTSIQTDRYNPIAGSGGLWQASIGGPVFNGDSRTTAGAVVGYGGGGDIGGNGQDGYIQCYFSDIRPPLNGPTIDVDTVVSLDPDYTRYVGSPITQTKGIGTISIPSNANYICVIYACAGGGYGQKSVGGSGSSILGTWWRVYPEDTLQYEVGAGGIPMDDSKGQLTSITNKHQGTDIVLFQLMGGKSDGTAGKYVIGSGVNLYNGVDRSTAAPIGVQGPYGGGGTIGQFGQDGILCYTFTEDPPFGVTVYDSRQYPLYNQVA